MLSFPPPPKLLMTQVHAKLTKAMNMKTDIENIQAPASVIVYLSV